MLPLEELHPARDLVGNALARQLQLDVERLEVRAVKNRDVGERAAFVEQALDAFDDELGLLAPVHGLDEKRLVGVRPVGAQLLVEMAPLGLRLEHAVGEGEDLRVDR